jgi:hypothetical protein
MDGLHEHLDKVARHRAHVAQDAADLVAGHSITATHEQRNTVSEPLTVQEG